MTVKTYIIGPQAKVTLKIQFNELADHKELKRFKNSKKPKKIKKLCFIFPFWKESIYHHAISLDFECCYSINHVATRSTSDNAKLASTMLL